MEDELEQKRRIVEARLGTAAPAMTRVDSPREAVMEVYWRYEEAQRLFFKSMEELAAGQLEKERIGAAKACDATEEQTMRALRADISKEAGKVIQQFADALDAFERRKTEASKELQARLLSESVERLLRSTERYLTAFQRYAVLRNSPCKAEVESVYNKHAAAVRCVISMFQGLQVPKSRPKEPKLPQFANKAAEKRSLSQQSFVQPPIRMTPAAGRALKPQYTNVVKSCDSDSIASILRRQRHLNASESKQLKMDLLWPGQKTRRFSDCDDFQREVFVHSLVRPFDVGKAISSGVTELEKAEIVDPTEIRLQELFAEKEELLQSMGQREEDMHRTLNASDSARKNWQKAQNSATRREYVLKLDRLERKILATRLRCDAAK